MTARASQTQPPDSSTPQVKAPNRRANKPLMEKRRRARINQSLAVLKSLILDSAKLENTKHSKLEKADILELTVRHLQRQKALNSSSVDKYRAGFIECAREVTRFLESPELGGCGKPLIENSVRQRLTRHLESCAAEIALDFASSCVEPLKPIDCETERRLRQLEELLVNTEEDEESCAAGTRPDSSTNTPGDENNNSNNAGAGGDKRPKKPRPKGQVESGPASTSANPVSLLQVIPSRLPDGQVVFLLPSHYVQLSKDDEKEKGQEMPIDFSVKKGEEIKEEEEVWRPW
ncbi:transcription factor HES-1-like [Cimex lectularius]|uniref:Uncharacterized protein n=1 Tax=Cimex lectularius TaxID=79782 RepID=A0A8I6S6M6_CIMLE|nr:transcription factor HES-1-like [Cimex lectularius]